MCHKKLLLTSPPASTLDQVTVAIAGRKEPPPRMFQLPALESKLPLKPEPAPHPVPTSPAPSLSLEGKSTTLIRWSHWDLPFPPAHQPP